MLIGLFKSIISSSLIAFLSFSPNSFGEEIEINVENLIAILPTDLPQLTWKGDLTALEEGKQDLIFRAAFLQAQAECLANHCGSKRCTQIAEVGIAARPFNGGFYRQIDDIVVETKTRKLSPVSESSELIELSPDTPLNFLKSEPKQRRTAYFSYLKCTDQNSPDPFVVVVPQTNLTSKVQSELYDWFQIIKSIGPGVLGAVAEGYHATKETARTCPKTAAKWGVCRLLSIISPGMAGSQAFGDLANRYALQMEAERSSTESNFMRRERLKEAFERMRSSFSPGNVDNVRSLLGQIDSRLNTQFDHSGELPHLLNQFDAILSLPKATRVMTAMREGQAIKDFFREREYPREIQEQIYEAFALHAVAQSRDATIPVQPIVLKGLPGTGKTSLLTELSKKIDARLCLVQLNTTPNEVENYLLGSRGQHFGPQNGGPTFGKIVDCLIQPGDKTQPIILFFDELEKVLNQKDSGPARQFFLNFFNPSSKKTFTSQGLSNFQIDLKGTMIFAAINDDIISLDEGSKIPFTSSKTGAAKEDEKGKEKEPTFDQPKPDAAFKSRLKILVVNPPDRKARLKIAHYLKESAMEALQITTLSDEAEKNFEAILEYDNEPGVRVLEAAIYAVIARQAAQDDGWELAPMNVKVALQQTQELFNQQK